MKFRAKKGQIDYTRIRWAPVINCVLKHQNKILLVRRSGKLNYYPGYWNGISGFLDDRKNLREKVKEELKEELGISEKLIQSIKLGEIFLQEEPKYKKTWIVHPVLVIVSGHGVKIDWEADNFKWVTLAEAKKLKLLPGFSEVLQNLFSGKKLCLIK